MRILIADGEVSQVLSSQMLAKLAKYGSIDIVQNGRAAVLAYVNSVSRGVFHDLIILDRNLTVLDGFAAVEMIRMYESDHRATGKRTMICVISDDDSSCQQHEVRYGQDERTHLLRKPANLELLESLADCVAAERGLISQTNFAPMSMKQPVSSRAWATAH